LEERIFYLSSLRQKKEYKKKEILKKISLIDNQKKKQLIQYFLDNSKRIFKYVYKKWKISISSSQLLGISKDVAQSSDKSKENNQKQNPKLLIKQESNKSFISHDIPTSPPKQQFIPSSSDLNKLILRGIEDPDTNQKEILFLDNLFQIQK